MKKKLIVFFIICIMACLGGMSYALEIKQHQDGLKFSSANDLKDGLYKIADEKAGLIIYILKENDDVVIETAPL